MEEPRSPSLGQVVRKAIEAQVAALRVSLPGRIEKYDPATRRANVKPLVRDVYFDMDGVRQADSLPVVTDVPVLFPGGGGYSLTFPVAVGDPCLLLFSDSSLDVWKARGGEVDPLEVRPHDLSNAVALVGLQDFAHATAAHADNVALGKSDGACVELTPAGDVLLHSGGAVDFVALAAKVKAELDAMRSTLASLVAAYNGHTHLIPVYTAPVGTPAPTPPTTSQATPPAPIGLVAASKVKAE